MGEHEETLEILKELRDNLRKTKETLWHRHPLFIALVSILFTALIAASTGYIELPSKNKKSIQILNKKIDDNKTEDTRKWDVYNNNIEKTNENFEQVADDDQHIVKLKKVDN